MRTIFLLYLAFYSINSSGQDLKKIEQDLKFHLERIHYWSGYGTMKDIKSSLDSLVKENEILEQKLLNYLSKQPATLTYDFKNIPEALTIVSSPDKKLRIYSWDMWTGGTMHFYKNVYQYQAGSKVFSKSYKAADETDAGGWFSEIFSLDNNGKNIYMGYFNAVYSSKEVYQAVKLFTISNNDLVDSKLIKTKSGMNNELGFGFDFFSVVDRKERPIKLIYFDSKQKTIKIPVVTVKGVVTKNFIVYKFTGKYFEYQGK